MSGVSIPNLPPAISVSGNEEIEIVQNGTSRRATVSQVFTSAVTSVSFGSTGLTPSTATQGAVTVAGTLAAANGGTGQSSYTTGDLLYASGATALAKLADVATGNALLSGGVGVAPAWGKIGLTTHVSGTLPVANGGTGVTTSTGSGSVVRSTSPTLVTPTLGAASATSIAAGLGAAATPSYTFTGDLNTGFWSPGADILAASTGGSERMRIDSAGYVGIGTSAPSFELDVKGAGATTSARIVGGGITTAPASGGTLTIHTLTLGVARTGLDISFTDGLASRLGGFKFSDTQTSGDWTACQMEMVQSYGAANEIVSKLQVEDATWAGMRFVSQTNAGAALATSPTFIWRNYTTEQMRITAAGNIQLGGGVLATNATNGFPYIPTCAGTPTGTPTAISGFAPMVVDSTNNKLYVYVGGAWQAMN